MIFLSADGTYYEERPQNLAVIELPDRPSCWHEWSGSAWVENIAARQASENGELNAPILAEIAALEQQQLRPCRELLLDSANAYAASKLATLDAQIAALRSQLVII